MYYLTIRDPIAFRSTLTSPTIWRRVYRWEDKWGYQQANDWHALTRKTVATDGEKYVLESVTPYPTHAPPPDVDDVWEEEIHVLPYGSCGNVLEIQGTLSEIQNICATHKISLPSVITSYRHKEIPTSKEAYRGQGSYKGGKQKNVCLIIDV
jgi:hypothetical protein